MKMTIIQLPEKSFSDYMVIVAESEDQLQVNLNEYRNWKNVRIQLESG